MSIINANSAKMRAFAGYVSEFGRNVLEDCEALESATKKLASSMSSEDTKTIESMVSKIEMIVHASAPVFQMPRGAGNAGRLYRGEVRRALRYTRCG